MSIETYGTGERLKCAARLLGHENMNRRLVLLPVPSTRDKKYVTDTDILFEDVMLGLGEGALIVGYGIPESQIAAANERGAEVLDLSRDEKYLRDNAYITALGAVGYILTTTAKSPGDLTFGVVGYGRIGSALTRILLFLGGRVKVFTSRNLTRLELGECGVSSSSSCDIAIGCADFSGIDILINTAPKNMAGCFRGKVPPEMRVLELASGKNFEGVSGVEYLPALPEKMYPESAGKTYFDAVMRFLESDSEKKERR